MKKLLSTIVILLCVISTYSQVLAPKGIRTGKAKSTTIGVVDFIATYGGKAKFYRGSTLLSPVNPDSLVAQSYLVFKSDSTGNAAGKYMTRLQTKNLAVNKADTNGSSGAESVTRYQFKNIPTIDNTVKIWKKLVQH